MPPWRDQLACGAIRCRVTHADGTTQLYTPTHPDQLWTPVPIPALGQVARGEFFAEFVTFTESGQTQARYLCTACKTIEKFGAAMQFQATYSVEFFTASA